MTPRLLLVGGDAEFAHDVAELCTAAGLLVVGACEGGNVAAQQAADGQPDGVILLTLAHLDEDQGVTTLRLLRQAAPRAWIVVWSALRAAEVIETSLSHGADAYVIKHSTHGNFHNLLAALGWSLPSEANIDPL
jgi:DNA-binding NarL/FixJ family response regulator